MLGAIAFERSTHHRGVGHAGNREHGIFPRVVGDRLEDRVLGEFQGHVAPQGKAPLLLDRVNHVGAAGHEHGASGHSDFLDRGLDRFSIVGPPVAFGALVLDVDDERRFGRRHASSRCGVLRVGGRCHEATCRQHKDAQETSWRPAEALQSHDVS